MTMAILCYHVSG